MPFHKFRQFPYDLRGAIRIEAPVIEHGVRAVAARIGAAYAGGIRQPALAISSPFVGIEINQVVSRRGQVG